MRQELPDKQNIQNQADKLINSFRNSFWINKHQWFCRCFIYNKTIQLKTSSEIFYYFQSNFPDWWNSTYPHDNQQEFYSNITSIYDNKFIDPPFPFAIRLNNIHDLSIKLPVTDEFLSMIPNLNKLKFLSILFYTDIYQSQLQTLLDRAPHLCDLHITLDVLSPLKMSLFEHTNPSIRQLTIIYHWFNEEECITLTHSPLGTQCEELSIEVKNRQNITILLENMINLRFLNIECKDDKYAERLLLIDDDNELRQVLASIKDEPVEWLKEHLPSMYLISRDPYFVNRIRIWI
ncbi:unnamed protein product [Rotaria sordida]|uniref:Uncharacterized protein n=1 Tax=Rotaria sordida TaxID=392033 RepID=A0A815RLG2_9BILA|nr:unnamed protein product [Rotaria sordida]